MNKITRRIIQFNKGRLPDILPFKYQKMANDVFSFFRGTCHIFYEDLHRKKNFKIKSPLTWICGDLHLENFGSYKGSNRLVYFDLNDFDEAILAPCALELVRIIASIFIAFDALGLAPKKAQNISRLFLKNYTASLLKGKAFYIERQTAKGIVYEFLNKVNGRKKKEIVNKKTTKKKGQLSILMADPKHLEIEPIFKRELIYHITEWIMYHNDSPYNFEVTDAAFRLAGTSSLGLKRYVLLLKNIHEPTKHMLVEMKQCAPSCLNTFVKIKQPTWNSEAERVVAIQQRMQHVSPALASAIMFKDEPYIIQEMQSSKDGIDFNRLQDRYRDMCQVIDDMAVLTASAQLRSSGRQGSATADDLIAFAENNNWHEKIITYAATYTKQVKADYRKFKQDYKKELQPKKKKDT